MKPQNIPFNISLLELTPDKLRAIRPVTVLDIFEGGIGGVAGSQEFHNDGLFSTFIFGKVGDERRDARFSYVDIKVPVMHPIVFNTLVKMKRLYGDILAGTGYARWDPVVQDFVRATSLDGRTGYAFFIEHWKDIVFGETKSTGRDQGIRLLTKFKDKAMTDRIVVLPAGLRDMEIDENNRRTEDEINLLYRQIIKLANTIQAGTVKTSVETLNIPRYRLQVEFNNIYEYLSNLIEGKKKLFLGKFASRTTNNGTRNVITAMDMTQPYLGGPGSAGFNSTVVGLYQFMKATLPITIFKLRELLTPMFPDVNSPARLVDKDTLESEEIILHSRYYNQWATNEGLEKIITTFNEESVRSKPLEIDGRYLALIYKGPDNTFRILHDINELPETRSREHVSAITFAELLYIAVYEKSSSFPGMVTRYPITGIGSIYPSWSHLKVTVQSERRVRLDENWLPMDESHTAHEFPLRDSPYMNSLVPHPSRLGRLGADYDGDTSSFVVAYSEEAIAENKRYMGQRKAYVGSDGKFINGTGVYTVELVLNNMTS